MFTVPTEKPCTKPDDDPIEATPILPLSHVPPVTPSVNVVVNPLQTVSPVVIAAGTGLTVNMARTEVHVGVVYEIVAVPAVIALTRPDTALILTLVLLALHTPPVTTSLNEEVKPAQALSVPKIAVGAGFTFTVVVMRQPVGSV